MKRLLEKIAYFSIGLDFFVALATLLVTQGFKFSSTMLLVGGYLLFIEVVLTGVVFMLMAVLQHYRPLLRSINSLFYNSRYIRRKLILAFGITR
jgi:hypothetical protein